MPDWTMSCLRIGLSRSGVSLLRTSRWGKPRVTMLKEAEFAAPIESAQQLKGALQTALAGIDVDCRRASIVLADEWVHYLSVALPANVTRLADCKAVADLRFQRLYDLDPTEWKIDATWSATQNFLACAVPRWLIEALAEFTAQHALHLTGIVPQFVGAWNQWQARIAPDSWFGLVHQGRITFSALQGKRPVDVDTIFAAGRDGADSSWLQQQLQRNALMQGKAAPMRLYLGGTLQSVSPAVSANAFQVIPLDMPELPGVVSSQGVVLAMQGY